jgi:caffeoyl-CoA O-methyltransferase
MASQLSPAVAGYLEQLESFRAEVFREMEEIARREDFPIIGPQCGRVLACLALAIGARRVFEMGSGFGYSTLWFALALGKDGEVVHTDYDARNSERAREFLKKAGAEARCRFKVGDAVELLVAEPLPFDFVLIDIDKLQYLRALEVAVRKVRVGGLIVAHNVLWHGRVADPKEGDEATETIRRFNRAIMEHPELLSFINPVHDGLSVSLRVDPLVKRRVMV